MGKLLAVVLVVVSIVAIAGLLYRPATVIGASEKSIAYSLRQQAGSDEAHCRGEDDRFTCVLQAPDSPARSGYRVSVDDYGCWDARSAGGGEARGAGFEPTVSGCITISDLIRSGD